MLGACHWLPVVADGDWAPGHDYFSEARPLHGRESMHPVVVSEGLGTACTLVNDIVPPWKRKLVVSMGFWAGRLAAWRVAVPKRPLPQPSRGAR